MTMPRSLQEILDHADEYADRFENYDPEPGDRRSGPEVVVVDDNALMKRVLAALDGLGVASRARADIDRAIIAGVRAARGRGDSWAAIGHELGTSGEAARQKYALLVSA